MGAPALVGLSRQPDLTHINWICQVSCCPNLGAAFAKVSDLAVKKLTGSKYAHDRGLTEFGCGVYLRSGCCSSGAGKSATIAPRRNTTCSPFPTETAMKRKTGGDYLQPLSTACTSACRGSPKSTASKRYGSLRIVSN
jgi:hypothetical protein